jgi:hypothetical protein
MRDIVDMQGRVRITLLDRAGRIVHDRFYRNLIVSSGRLLMAHLFAGPGETPVSGATPAQVSHMGVGTGANKVADGQTNLFEPVLRVPIRKVNHELFLTDTEPKMTRVATTLTAVFDYDEANGTNGSASLREAGIFTAADNGDMYNRVTFEEVTKTKAFKLTLNWKIIF